MAIGPQSKPSDTSPVSALDVKKKALEIKKNMAHKKTTNPKSKVNFDLSRNLIVSYDPKTAALAKPLNSQSKSSAIERANEVQASLPSELPSFVKLMLPSHVTGCFWLGLPKNFCDAHLPKDDVTVVLVDEDDQEYNTKYLDRKTGLSGGWRGFSIAHKLLAGDALVFQLIEQWKMKGLPKNFCDAHLPKDDVTVVLVDEDDQEYNTKYLDRKTGLSGGWRGFSIAHKLLAGDALVFQLIEQWKMKVYIVRASGLNEIDGALGLMNLVPCDMNSYVTEYVDSPVSEGLRFSQSVIEFKDIKGVDDFNIVVDNLVIDSEIPKHFQIKYYDLCRSQNMYLHENLLKGLNVKLAVGIILETVTIADAIRACKVTITRDDIATWDKTLMAFEEVGMKVGFLRARIGKLMGLLFESKELLEAKRTEQMKAEEEMRVIKEKLCGVREVIKNLDVEMETLKLKGQKLEPVFHEEANAPW
ncbi:B3 DNA binding domain-containing protein [Artemisia annua]|uniref:B3 DNA binding domain-containing protein n=1 Tax=Artemisia annua TaxID=35608 RepID=A0A2U1MM20_ARTAN|nr:B3 DNA binding domain-containing protein [Artemisia annua]